VHFVSDLFFSSRKAPYSRETAAYPLPYLKAYKFWPSVSRLNDTHGDLNLIVSYLFLFRIFLK